MISDDFRKKRSLSICLNSFNIANTNTSTIPRADKKLQVCKIPTNPTVINPFYATDLF